MARQVIVLALVFFAVVGLASAAGKRNAPEGAPAANPPKASSGTGAPVNENAIGTTDEGGDDDASVPDGTLAGEDLPVAAPLGSEATYASYPSAEPPKKNGANALGVSAVAGVSALAGSFFFF